jgi:Protein of unknown function (DUF3999)
MTTLRSWVVILTWILTITGSACAAQTTTTPPDSQVASYTLRLPLKPQGNASVQRFTIPTQALIASQSADMNDVRVFDANGRIVPMARLPVAPAPSVDVTLQALPILGSSTPLHSPGVSLKMDGQGRVRVISVDGKTIEEKTRDGNTTANVVGTLLDARGQSGAAQRLVVNAVIPTGQPVTLIIEGSEDLKTWRPLGEGSIYRPPNEVGKAFDSAIALNGQLSGNTQLRVTWRTDTPLLAPVLIRKAILTSQPAPTQTTKIITATVPPLVDNYTLEFAVPFATPIATIAIDAKGGEGLLPVVILGRNNNQEPWAPMGQGNSQAASEPISLSNRPITMIRIEADRRTSGFAAPPALRLGMTARDIAFVTLGTPPFTFAAGLARGQAGTRDVFLPLDSITQLAPDAVPQAGIADPDIATLVLASAGKSGTPTRDLMLWATLLGLTVLLGGMAWRLWKRPRFEDPPLAP